MINLQTMAKEAKAASVLLAQADTSTRNKILARIASELEAATPDVLKANSQDVSAAQTAGMPEHMVDRLMLNEKRWQGVLADLRKVIDLPDPVGEIIEEQKMPNGLAMRRQRVPLGVLAVIYEARPNVTVDVVGLALKSGNAVILRGGSETIHTNRAIVTTIRQAMDGGEIPAGVIQFIDDPDRKLVLDLMKLYEDVDMLIPRGGAGLHKFCRENSMIPVITGGIGICHLFVDEKVDVQRSIEVIRNAKIQRPSVCNALDTVLVHARIATQFLPVLVDELSKNGVRFKAEPRAYQVVGKSPTVDEAGPEDFDTEWLSLVLGLKVVDSLNEAVEHIRDHSTAHSDGILTDDARNAQIFIHRVDSAAVYVNASTRFTDGAQMGLGAEIAVSTQKLHARGPMGLKELTTYKWVVQGDYHIRG